MNCNGLVKLSNIESTFVNCGHRWSVSYISAKPYQLEQPCTETELFALVYKAAPWESVLNQAGAFPRELSVFTQDAQA